MRNDMGAVESASASASTATVTVTVVAGRGEAQSQRFSRAARQSEGSCLVLQREGKEMTTNR